MTGFAGPESTTERGSDHTGVSHSQCFPPQCWSCTPPGPSHCTSSAPGLRCFVGSVFFQQHALSTPSVPLRYELWGSCHHTHMSEVWKVGEIFALLELPEFFSSQGNTVKCTSSHDLKHSSTRRPSQRSPSQNPITLELVNTSQVRKDDKEL